MPDLAPTEIVALARILGELDYYQLLHLAPTSTPRDVRNAYHACSRSFHPDAQRYDDPEVARAVAAIAKRVSEAYSVLRSPHRRRAYDAQILEGGAGRMQLAQAEAAAQSRRARQEGKTREGRQFFTLAQRDLARGDDASALRNLRTAITFEPDNSAFRDLLASLRKR